jgi:WD40 repeat protein
MLADGRVVVTDAHKHLRIFAPDGVTLLADLFLPTRGGATTAPSPDGRRLVTIPSHLDDTAPLALWDIERSRLRATLDGHAGLVSSARFVRDGHEILTAGDDGTAKSWDARVC